MTTIHLKTINITTNFENLSIELRVKNIKNTHVKFHVNRILIIIRSINLYFIHNFILQNFEI